MRRHVRSWNRRARVTDFVAIMAARDARSELLNDADGWITEEWWSHTGGADRVSAPRP